MAISRDWRHLVLPGVVVGLFGYAVGNFLGLGVAGLLRYRFRQVAAMFLV